MLESRFLPHYLRILENVAAGKRREESGMNSAIYARHAAPLVAAGLLFRRDVLSRYELSERGQEAIGILKQAQEKQGEVEQLLSSLSSHSPQ